MPIITLTLSNAAAAEVVDAFCEVGGYQATLPDGSPNPVTRAEFARQVLIQRIRRMVLDRRERAALAAVDGTPPDIT